MPQPGQGRAQRKPARNAKRERRRAVAGLQRETKQDRYSRDDHFPENDIEIAGHGIPIIGPKRATAFTQANVANPFRSMTDKSGSLRARLRTEKANRNGDWRGMGKPRDAGDCSPA